eukprot:6088246-Pyramimonas_sp.AAC.1
MGGPPPAEAAVLLVCPERLFFSIQARKLRFALASKQKSQRWGARHIFVRCQQQNACATWGASCMDLLFQAQ